MSQSLQITGNIHQIHDTQEFASGFKKREFTLTIDADTQYPQHIKFEILKDKCEVLELYDIGNQITVHFNLRGNEYNGKFYTTLQAWKLQNANGQTPQPASQAQPLPPQSQQADPVGEDDIPF